MTGADLMELAAWCEAASGPDRGLDALIAYQHHGFYVRDEGHPLGRQCYDTHGIAVELPRYTASLDAAMTLVGKDEFWSLGNDGEGPDPADFMATVTAGAGTSRLVFCDAVAVTPALALTAAALKARATTQGKDA